MNTTRAWWNCSQILKWGWWMWLKVSQQHQSKSVNLNKPDAHQWDLGFLSTIHFLKPRDVSQHSTLCLIKELPDLLRVTVNQQALLARKNAHESFAESPAKWFKDRQSWLILNFNLNGLRVCWLLSSDGFQKQRLMLALRSMLLDFSLRVRLSGQKC